MTLVYNVDPLRNPIDPADPLNGAHGSLVNALHQVAAAQRALANAAAAISPWILAVTGDEGAF